MERNFGEEIDQLREDINALKADLGGTEKRDNMQDQKAIMEFYGKTIEEYQQVKAGMEKEGKTPPEWGTDLAATAIEKHYDVGFVRSAGIYKSPADEGHIWKLDHPIDELLKISEATVERVLSAFGNRLRVRILTTILQKPSTANELVDSLDMKTTGRAYHHLNMLEKADLIAKDDQGRYHFHGHRVSAFFSALSCVQEIIDDRYTKAEVEELPLSAETR